MAERSVIEETELRQQDTKVYVLSVVCVNGYFVSLYIVFQNYGRLRTKETWFYLFSLGPIEVLTIQKYLIPAHP